MPLCPLCHTKNTDPYFHDTRRQCEYLRCPNCDLIFMDPKFILSKDKEKERYDEHNNTLDDPRYLKFVSTLSDLCRPHLKKGQRGLDFGCGVAAPLAHLLKNDFKMEAYDPYYFKTGPLTQNTYDFILATEVVEHLPAPKETFDFLKKILKPSGLLGLKSFWHKDERAFDRWFYRNDDTHISFYSKKTLEFIAETWGFKILKMTNREVLLKYYVT